MTRNIYMLLPDGREPSGSVLSALKMLGAASLTASYLGTWLVETDMEAGEMIVTLQEFDWHHPILLAYRQAGENRWSFLTITGRNHVSVE